MNDKTDSIVLAAFRLFSRYGFSKTTMGDIATEAGVARQTVYNAFPGKEEILRAVVRQAGEDTIAQVQAAWATSDSLEEKLTHYLELAPIAWFEAIQASPDSAELIEGMHQAAAHEIAQLDQQWRAAFEDMIAQSLGAADGIAVPLDDVIEFFLTSAMGAKTGATDTDHLRRRLDVLKKATLALL